ncbi:exonuclease domain-containing protein [Thauera linaloolentis]|uniref:DNA-directed DNA polymerase n=1 Tax=Thauera linaloolentis (strain DSM 12138 / JCM 21573 / CCUG 41526 / CIP 105981 / IAM 15112 / NBRC 102519 / 47Lol) TaxID=1123367 RepID=N6YA88_THAL4|nr:exonuclease domain-containing protein [Thauera linaloolentis]ENO88400.1 DNA polymerase III subunit epsilon [Thauera linaloolentis 47Lol = DSM 12138]MCM8566449.1 exonuclease domain-containing protein [Thauera linaloolentis]
MSLPRRLAFIDVESTGAHPVRDRITEIAILRVEDGVLVDRWESLVDPEAPIPPLIQQITGITDEMVAGAPRFEALADHVRSLLADCVFVAHNARFDFGFIKNAFSRLGQPFDAHVLCTVKLSRALFPEHHRHGLDALIERHGLQCGARHRAMGDTEALWQFVQMAQARFAPDALLRAAERAMKAPASPPGLPEGLLEAIPDVPGVYFLHAEPEAPPPGRSDRPLFIGRAASLRARVREHFAGNTRKGKDAELRERTRRVEWIETAGELGSLLLEAERVKRLRPPCNRAPEEGEDAFALRFIDNRRRPPIYERVPVAGTDPAAWADLHGVFRNRREVDNRLRELALLYRLCPRRLGLESGTTGACSAFQARRCAGVCARRETVAEHDARLRGGLASLGVKPWPWPGAVVVAERDPHSGCEAWHVFDQWCHLGSVDRREDLQAVDRGRRFDVDTWRLLGRWFGVPAHAAAVEPLAPAPS